MRKFIAITCIFLFVFSASAQNYTPSASNLEARENFRQHALGIFLHWGIYSMFGQGEWYMTNANINNQEYAKAAAGFYPANFNAAEWVRAIKNSGAGYICITSRHHDGFSMFNTAYSDYNIVKATPYGRDILMELSEECHKQGLKFHVYYSLIDWTRDDYYPLGRTGRGTGRTTHGDYGTYFDFMMNQVTELVTKYKADCIWFDGEWDQDQNPGFEWRFQELYERIHQLNPACLVANNHHHDVYPGEDFQIFERDVPGENEAGYSGEQQISRLPLETCQTMNGMWGYKASDLRYKSAATLIQLLVRTAAKGANLLINIGPQPSGDLPALALERLAEYGKWMEKYGVTVKGAESVADPEPWGVMTKKGDVIYLHIFKLDGNMLNVQLPGKVKSAIRFDTGEAVSVKQTKEGYTLVLNEIPSEQNLPDYVIAVTLK